MNAYPEGFNRWPLKRRNEHFAQAAEEYAARDAATPAPVVRQWAEPKPLPDGLAAVAPFDIAFLPEAVATWVADIADRMQCPTDFVGVPAMVALGVVLGRKLAIRPQQRSDWTEVPNLWGCIVGRPGMIKSLAMSEALKPLHRLEKIAREAHADAAAVHARDVELFKLKSEAARDVARKAIKSGLTPSIPDLTEPEAPTARRYIINDTSYEALGEILADNPNGVLAFRDELVSLLKGLDREEQAARGFFLTAWNGTASYTFDRIIRGKTHIEAACLSLLGRHNRADSPNTSDVRSRAVPATTALFSDSASWFGRIKTASGEIVTAGRTQRRGKPPGGRSIASKALTLTPSGRSAINSKRCHSFALTIKRKACFRSGEPTSRDASARTTWHLRWKAISRSIESSFPR